jgi:predicted ferric reductase
VAAAVVHGLLVDPVLRVSVPLKACYLVVGGLGLAAYLYRELFARFVVPVYDYTVAEVRQPSESTVDVFLAPTGRALRFEPGQFIFLAFGGVDGWQRHPFSVASAPGQRQLEVSVKAVGDYTRNLHDKLKPGTPARVTGPFGGFDYRGGGRHQIWIAGGIGVTPFLSWIRALDAGFDREVAFFYSVARSSEVLCRDEIDAAAAAYPTLRPRVVDSSRDGYLTAERAASGIHGVDGHDVWVYMCGPPAMMTGLARDFRKRGIPASQIRWEQFNVR